MENQFKGTQLNKNQLKEHTYEILKKCIKKGRVHAHPFQSDYFILKGSNTQNMPYSYEHAFRENTKIH